MRDLLDTLVLVGVVQGVVLAVVLARRRHDPLAHRLLATLTGAVAAMLALGYCEQRWGFSTQPHFLALAAPLPFLFGPLLYLYIVALTRPIARFDPRWLAHGLPFLIDLIYMTQQFYLLDAPDKLAVARAYVAGEVPLSLYVIETLEIVQAVAYLAASWRALQRYGRKMQGYFSDLARIDLRWLRAMVLGHAATWSVVIADTVVRALGLELAVLDAFTRGVQVGSTVVIFLTGYMGLWQPELFQKAGAAAALEPPPQPDAPAPTAAPEPAPEPIPEPEPTIEAPAQAQPERPRPKYQRNRIEEAEAEELVARLLALMQEQRPYRDGDLTLPMLAEELGVTPHMLSQILNVRIDKSFYVFVNAYRVAELKEALADPEQNGRGVLELALAAGFNSKSTLNSFFKRQTGTTPTEYRARAQKSAPQVEAA